MKNNENTIDRCFSAVHLELLCLDETVQDPRIHSHVKGCMGCHENMDEIETFYDIFTDELRKPISNRVLEFAKQVNIEQIMYGLILCEPVPFSDGDHGKAYQTKLVFAGNGELGKNKLAGYNFSIIPAQDLAVRVMTDPAVNKLLLFLWSPNNIDFFDWTLFIPSQAENIRFNSAGAGKINGIDINDLNDKVIYLRPGMTQWIDKTRFESISEAIFF
jgi:hypothetical protein